MNAFNKIPLTYKLPLIIVVLALIAAGATAALVVSGTTAQIREMAEVRLEANVASRKAAVESGIEKAEQFLHAERGNPLVQTAMRELSLAWRAVPGDAAGQVRGLPLDGGGSPAAEGETGADDPLGRFASAHDAINSYLGMMARNQEYHDIFLIDRQGNVVYSAAHEEDFGANLVNGALAASGLGEVFAAAVAGGEGTYFSDIAPYGPSAGLPSQFTASPLMDDRGQVLGVMAVQSASVLNQVLQYNPLLGDTGETYIVGEDMLMRSQLKHADEPTALVKRVDDAAIEAALRGETGVIWAENFDGKPVLSAYAPIIFGELKWAVVSEQDRAEIYAPVNRLISEVLVYLVVTAVVITGVGVLVALSITRPLSRVGATMAQVAHRQFEVEIPATARGDEIGAIAKALAGFRDDLAEADVAAQKRAAMEAEQARVVEHLSGSLAALAGGDLTVRNDEPFAPEYEALRGNFNAAVEKLEAALSSVVVASENIRNESVQVTQAADELSHRTENQAAALEETAASLEELTASVKAAAAGAERASVDVAQTKQSAEESGRIVREAVDAMSEIEKSSQHISQIIGVIDDIAFQTNLLALNAGVEAARAGEAGRGFAVVASEVRALAQRSSDAAKEIKALISTSSQQVGRGVELVGQTGKSLQTIVEAVTGITALIVNIANSSREQSVGLSEINTAINQLDQVTQQNAAMVEESTAASHAMKSEAESLSGMVSQFKADLAKAAAPGSSHAAKASARTAELKKLAKSPTKPAAARLAAVPRVNGSAALAHKPSASHEEWQDF